MQRKRRSGRIAKEIAIVLLGTDTTGKMLSEETKTVVLSRHGAGVVSRYRFSPDALLTLRLHDPARDRRCLSITFFARLPLAPAPPRFCQGSRNPPRRANRRRTGPLHLRRR